MPMDGYYRFEDGEILPQGYGEFCENTATEKGVWNELAGVYSCYMTGAELAAAITKMMRPKRKGKK